METAAVTDRDRNIGLIKLKYRTEKPKLNEKHLKNGKAAENGTLFQDPKTTYLKFGEYQYVSKAHSV